MRVKQHINNKENFINKKNERKSNVQIKRTFEKECVLIVKDILFDNSLSLKAKGLFVCILSMPNDWIFSMKDVIEKSKEGRESTASAFKELVNKKYVKITKKRRPGKSNGFQYNYEFIN